MDSKKRRFSVQQNPCCTVCESTKARGKTPIQMYDHKDCEGHVSLKAEGYQGYEEDLESRNEKPIFLEPAERKAMTINRCHLLRSLRLLGPGRAHLRRGLRPPRLLPWNDSRSRRPGIDRRPGGRGWWRAPGGGPLRRALSEA